MIMMQVIMIMESEGIECQTGLLLNSTIKIVPGRKFATFVIVFYKYKSSLNTGYES